MLQSSCVLSYTFPGPFVDLYSKSRDEPEDSEQNSGQQGQHDQASCSGQQGQHDQASC